MLGSFVLLGGLFFIDMSHANTVAAAQVQINQQQEQLEERATTKVIALAQARAEERAQSEAQAKAEAAAKAEATAKAEAAAKAEAEAKVEKLQAEQAAQTQQDVEMINTNESQSNEIPTQAETNEAVQPSVSPSQSTLSFVDAGRAVVNQGCSGFFISQTQVVTASHCALASSTVQLAATGETFSASISQNNPGKDFAILTVNQPNLHAQTIGKRSASMGESVTIYSRLNGVIQASIVTQEVGTVTVNGDGTTQLNIGDNSLGSTINGVNVAVSVGDSGSIVIGSDGSYLGVIFGSDLASMSYFVS